MELDNPEDWAPLPELVHPVVQGGLGHNNHVGTRDAPELVEVSQQRNGLKGLAQALSASTKMGSPCAKNYKQTDFAHSGVIPDPLLEHAALSLRFQVHFIQGFHESVV